MAFNLKAILTLEDRMSSKLRQISRQTASLNNSLGSASNSTGNLSTRLARASTIATRFRGSIGGATNALNRADTAANRASSSLSRATSGFRNAAGGGSLFMKGISGMAGGIGNAISSVFSLTGALTGLGSAYAAVRLGENVFKATVGNAMDREQSGVVIDAMFNDKEASAAYKKMVEAYAIDSPTMESKQMFANSKSFISMTKNVDELKGLWSIVERLAAVDPYQGVEGGVFAMRELLSGDAISMARRFEMPKKELNEIKKLDVPGQIAAMNKLMDKMGMTQHLIDEMAKTTSGRWMQIKEKWSLMMADVGAPALEPLNKFFDDLFERFDSEDFQRFGKVGGKIIANIVSGLTSAAVRIYDWFTELVNSPEFQKRTTLSGKVIFFIEDIYKRFNTWMKEEGRGLLAKAMEEFLQIASVALVASQSVIVEAASTVGVAIGKALISGASKEFQGWFDGVMDNLPGILKMNPANLGYYVVDALKGNPSAKAKNQEAIEATLRAQRGIIPQSTGPSPQRRGTAATPSRNGGLDYVPYDGATYRLHKGEAILTRGENDARRKGVGGSISVGAIHLHGVGGDLEGAADKLLDIMARKIQLAGEGGA